MIGYSYIVHKIPTVEQAINVDIIIIIFNRLHTLFALNQSKIIITKRPVPTKQNSLNSHIYKHTVSKVNNRNLFMCVSVQSVYILNNVLANIALHLRDYSVVPNIPRYRVCA